MQGDTFNISCPVCKSEFPLTETLAQPLIDAERERAQLEVQERASALHSREAQLARNREELTELQKTLEERESTIETTIQEKLQSEFQERASALHSREAQLARNREELTELQKTLEERESTIETTIQEKLQS